MIRVRALVEADIEPASQILMDAFAGVYRKRGHVPPFPSLESATWLCRAYIDLDPDGCVVADQGGVILGVGFVHRRGPVASIGPLAARPSGPRGVGKALMTHFRQVTAGVRSVRLFQDAFNPDSFGLYTRLGFVVVDVAPYLLADALRAPATPPRHVRPVVVSDLGRLESFDRSRTGADRSRDLALLAASGAALMHEGDGGLDGFLFYRVMPSRVIIGPAVADSQEVLSTLLDAVAAALPGRGAVIRGSASAPAVVQRAFQRGFRVDHLGNLMIAGDHTLPPAQFYALFPESL